MGVSIQAEGSGNVERKYEAEVRGVLYKTRPTSAPNPLLGGMAECSQSPTALCAILDQPLTSG